MPRRFRICSLLILTTLLSGLYPLTASGSSTRTWKNSLGWQAGRYALNSKSNNLVISELETFGSSIGEKSIAKVHVSTFSSPEGTLSWNTKLSDRRSSAVVSLLKEKLPGLSDSLIVVEDIPEDWDSVIKYVEACDKDWKSEALELLKSGKPDIESRLQDLWGGVVWDELMWNCFTRIRRTVVTVEFTPNIQISESSQKAEVADKLCFKFPVGKTAFDKNYIDNATQFESLSSFVSALPEGAAVFLDSFSSPEGKSSWNEVLAVRRAESVKKVLVEAGVPADRITVRCCEENWAGLAESVRGCYFGSEKQTLLEIMGDESKSGDQKKQEIMSISKGSVWNRMVSDMMVGLRYVEVSFLDDSTR